jgi:type I restriction enzyme M protein
MAELWRYIKGATFMIQRAKIIRCVVQQIDQELPLDNRDTKVIYTNYMLGKIAEAGTNGQFRTPRHIIRMMVSINPKDGNLILVERQVS